VTRRRTRGGLVDVTGSLDRLAELLGDNPDRAERFGAWLDEQEDDVPKDERDKMTGIRLPPTQLTRADALANLLAEDPEIGAMGPVSRSGVLRLALAEGLDAIEQRRARRLWVLVEDGKVTATTTTAPPKRGGAFVELRSTSVEALAVVLGKRPEAVLALFSPAATPKGKR
jgi:hypothetical protein